MKYTSLNQYYTDAKKLVKRYASYNIANRILADNDSLGFVVRMMIEADERWDPTHPKKMKRSSYRVLRAMYAIRILISKYNRLKTLDSLETVSYNYGISESGFDKVDNMDTLDVLLSKLNSSDRQILKSHFIEKNTVSNIASNLGMSKSAVYDKIKRGIKKLKQYVD